MDTSKKIENIVKLSEEERYSYFIRKVADFEQLWGLNKDGWALFGDNLDNEVFPFWPEKEFAELCATGRWAGYIAKAIDLDSFLENWIPGMKQDRIQVNIFHVPGSNGLVVSADKLSSDINIELEEY